MFSRLFRGGRGQERGRGQGQGRGTGGGTKPGSGPTGKCICPKCGHEAAHQISVRCIDLACPKCGTKMDRG